MVSRRTLIGTGTVASTAVAIGGFSYAAAAADTATNAAPSVVDVGFCQDMTAHHVQALEMCQRVLGRDTGDEVQAAATEVLMNQSIEVGMMRAWLADWDESTMTPESVMSWMMPDGNAMALGLMPGYASTTELRELSQATGLEQGRQWLALMRAHHVGGVTMAERASELASSEKVLRIATTQAATQTFEIAQYDLLLETTYA